VGTVIGSAKNHYAQTWHQNTLSSVARYQPLQLGYVLAPYLSAVKGFKSQKLISRFRCGCHGLHVHTGRLLPLAQQVRREQRHCVFCASGSAEDEHYFVFDCPANCAIRNKFINIFWGPAPTLSSLFTLHDPKVSHEAFVDAELAKAEAKGVIVEWPFAEPPKVVNGLKVVEGKKNRLCINPMYINVFMEYFTVKYEGVRDLVDIIQLGDFMSTSDDKSGYWQLPLHPDMWQYMGMAWKDRYIVWRMTAFGISVLPWIYSTVKQEVYRTLRLRGIRLGYLIDDR